MFLPKSVNFKIGILHLFSKKKYFQIKETSYDGKIETIIIYDLLFTRKYLF